MIRFNVADMTCGHCASTITRALKDADDAAKVEISVKAEAGYTPKAL